MLMEVPYKPNANREDTQVENLCYGGELRGAARAREPALLTSGAMDGGAKSASSERRPGRPQQASGDGAWAAPSLVNARASRVPIWPAAASGQRDVEQFRRHSVAGRRCQPLPSDRGREQHAVTDAQ